VGQKVGWSEKGSGSMDPCMDSMGLGELTWPWNGNAKHFIQIGWQSQE
jgi:hypothetical protein